MAPSPAGSGVTIASVGRLAGVSIATVSRVLNNVPGQVSLATRRRVLRVIRELDYRPNALARSLHQKRTHTIGLILPDITNPYYAEIARGIEDAISRRDYTLITCNSDRKLDRISHSVALLREKQVDGIILGGGGTLGAPHFAALQGCGTRVVLIGRYEVKLPAVRVDNVAGARAAALHLLGLGHRHIVVLAGPPSSSTSVDRLAGYRRAFEESAVPFPSRSLRHGDLRPHSGYEAARRLFASSRPPTAILAANDQMAIGAMRAILECGLRVPDQVSVVGFDDIALASFVTPALTTMALPLHRMGVAAGEMILNPATGGRQEVWFTPRLVVRESSAAPSART
ncbi:MAG TPA: LacI family DNA-binding transcriptional regulator [Candidatus Sulfotelmatobacter sp.]|nr:LacI family DNA-binding transcriptional regulator [Candidatus Sulfotelmatobacter sp.]